MPIYEYYCPQCQKRFEVMKGMEERKSNSCPLCNRNCKLMPSNFLWKLFNPFTADGEGYTERVVSKGEQREMIQETRGR
jgi:putative FmdB family regulatory protein